MTTKVIIIAEAGVNHNGDLALAKQLIDAAAEVGADYIKFQTFHAETQVTKNASKAQYQLKGSDDSETQYEMLSRLELTESMHLKLIEHCKLRGIHFLSTPFDIDSIYLLDRLNLDIFKIPSGEITNLPYLRQIGCLDKNIILSTGMSTIDEIEAAIKILEISGTERSKITALHCTTEYPAPLQEVNLRAMQTMGNSLGVSIGYSDHTAGIEVAIAAVALGAKVIEKHFTLDQELPGPDHRASLEPLVFKEMVKSIRNVEKALGSDLKLVTASEVINKPIIRKSIVALMPIKKGEIFTANNLTTKRPGYGVSPMQWDMVLGMCAIRDFNQDELIEI